MKILCVGDIHGKHELVTEAFDRYIKEKYDKIIFLGDYLDSFDRKDEDMFRTINVLLAMKRCYSDNVVLLIGNHDEQYLSNNPELFKCSGFRTNIYDRLHALLAPEKRHFQYAYGIKNYLFTHAGMQLSWFLKHYNELLFWANRMNLEISNPENMWQILDGIAQTRDKEILFEIGPKRGGMDSNHGGIIWCDQEEILKNTPFPHLHQVVGHNENKYMRRIRKFGNSTAVPETSVTFIDCLNSRTQFLTLNI